MSRNKEFDYEDKLKDARDLFWKKGYNATSINDLVDTMKINRSSIYLTYGNKHELFLKSLNSYIKKKDAQYREAANKTDLPLEAVKNIIYSVYESAVQDNNCLFTNSVFELGTSDEKTAKILTNQALVAVDLLEKLLQEAQQNGTISNNRSPRSLAHFIVSGLTSIYNTQILFNDRELTKQTAEILIDTVSK